MLCALSSPHGEPILEVASYEIPRPQWTSKVPANLLCVYDCLMGTHPLARQKSKETPSNGPSDLVIERRDTLYLRILGQDLKRCSLTLHAKQSLP